MPHQCAEVEDLKEASAPDANEVNINIQREHPLESVGLWPTLVRRVLVELVRERDLLMVICG